MLKSYIYIHICHSFYELTIFNCDIKILKVPENLINIVNFNNKMKNYYYDDKCINKINYPHPSLVCFQEKYLLDV